MKRTLSIDFDNLDLYIQRPYKKIKLNEDDYILESAGKDKLGKLGKHSFLEDKVNFTRTDVQNIIKIVEELMDEKCEKKLLEQRTELYENFSKYCEDYLGYHKTNHNFQEECSYIS